VFRWDYGAGCWSQMKLEGVSEEQIVRALARAWDEEIAPNVHPACCILASRCARETLLYFNLSNQVLPLKVYCYNESGFDNRFTPLENWHDEAWGVGTGELAGKNEYAGHIVVLSQNWFIDLSAKQYDRPQKGILTGGSIVKSRDEIVFLRTEAQFPLKQGIYTMRLNAQNQSFKKSPDWLKGYRDYSGILIRTVKDLLNA